MPEAFAVNLRRRMKTKADVSIMRSSQLDAGRLDTELASMLQEQLQKVFSIMQPVMLPLDYMLEAAIACSRQP